MTGTVKRPQGAHHNVDLNLFERSVIPWNQVTDREQFLELLGMPSAGECAPIIGRCFGLQIGAQSYESQWRKSY